VCAAGRGSEYSFSRTTIMAQPNGQYILARNMKIGRREPVGFSALPTAQLFWVTFCELCLENRKIEMEDVMSCTIQEGA